MRRIIALLLIALLLLPIGISAAEVKQVSAASNKAEKVINALGIMKTDKGIISEGTEKITRSQYAQLLVNLSDLKDATAVSSNVSLFGDVSKKHWAAGYIKTAISKGWMSGYLDGTFKPNNGVTLIEAINGVLRLLGYTDSDFAGNIVGSKMALYTSKELNKNITVSIKTAYLSYSNCVNLFNNTLNAKTKEGKVYAETLGYTLDSNGELDYLSLINTGTEGPIVADDSWTSKIPFSIHQATWYKNDLKCSYTDIDEYDVLYYSESSSTVWAYDTKVTGTLQSINPDLLAPASVTVAGVDYKLESSEASLAFSSVGSVEKGDIVTLLLGKNGAIAGVLDLDEYNTTITGVVLSVGTHLIENEEGNYVNSAYVTYVDAGGNKYSQDFDDDNLNFVEDDLIRVTYQDGVSSVKEYEKYEFIFGNNLVNSNGTVIGNAKLASNVKILDLYEGKYTKVYPIRLADVTMNDTMIYYYATNYNGEITEIILRGATGDLDEYGIFTGYSYTGNTGAYNYVINGKDGMFTTTTFKNLSSTQGPTGFKYEGTNISATYQLTDTPVSAIGNTTITSKGTKYPLAEKLSVYILSNEKYNATTIDKISDLSKYKVTAYYDKAISLGGRIRVIVAEPIK
ncbi:MAG: hypothetical protein K0S01_1366 [Herbinix sp.]|jgi:hypothetical protein|nr:hypothetical protein [Herbinix sp.]